MMVNLPKLVLVPGSGDSYKMARRVKARLTNEFRLAADLVRVLRTDGKGMGKEKSRIDPLLVGRFPGTERQIRTGEDILWSEMAHNHVAFVQYSFQPTGVDQIDSLHMEVRGFFNLLQEHGLPLLKRTAALPYMPYLRSHSIEKYGKIGHFEFNSLKMVVGDYARESVDDVICLDPHSGKGADYAEASGMGLRAVDPFQAMHTIFWPKLGFVYEEEDDAHKVTEKLQPFVNRYREVEQKYKSVVMICPDSGAEERVQNFLLNVRAKKRDIGYIHKRRIKDGEVEIQGFKWFSPIQEKHIIEMARAGSVLYIIPDDMVSSGGTVDDIAEYIKNIVAEHAPEHVENVRVESWTTHPLCEEPAKFRKRANIDEFVCLDTVVQDSDQVNLTYIEATDLLLASALVKSYYSGLEGLVGSEEMRRIFIDRQQG